MALDGKAMPGVAVYAGPVQADGKVVIDQTRHDLPSPDPEAADPRRVGVRVNGQLSPVGKDGGQWRINLEIRDCKHAAYLYGAGEKKFHPSLTESRFELIGKMPRTGKDSWLLFDTDEKSENPRAVYMIQVTE
ncbi:MAG: hypothetical protein EOP85_22545 [Verrucomicrobiaceae bacterium]|nr:MAG: hypothetical protein EOP85_22545 [Verrucomicrobiaceae bacterium]